MADFEGRVDGFKVDRPADYMPSHIIAKVGIHREKLIAFLMQQEGDWINIDICQAKVSKKFYGKQNIRSGQSSNSNTSSFQPDTDDSHTGQEYNPPSFPDSPGPHDEDDMASYNTQDYLDF